MRPRLLAIDGPLADQSFPLSGEPAGFSLGRDPANHLQVPDSSASRRHCLIRQCDDGRFLLVDSGSHNGTYVNGLPVEERVLEHGDQVKVGRSHFVFLLRESDAPSVVEAAHLAVQEETVVRLRREDSLYLRPQDAIAASATSVPRALQALLSLAGALRTTEGIEKLARQTLDLVLDYLPAGRAAIVLVSGAGAEPDAVFACDRGRALLPSIALSREFVERGIREGVALFSNRAFSEAGETSSVMVAPLVSRDRLLGVFYLDSNDPKVAFGEEHLQLLAAMGLIAGPVIEDAAAFERLRGENERLAAEAGLQHEMIGQSPAARAVYRLLAKVAPADCTVLICGETGTGKELAARAIHRNSPRAARPFVAINCATLTESLLESDLFGHERGAFTGAVAQKRGKFELAHGGTLFLDEVGELSLPLQAKLLRVLQERRIERVGGIRSIEVDVRVIAATNRDLRAAVDAGAFRADLYYRLDVVSLLLPPLRDRRDDIPLLADHFALSAAQRLHRRFEGVAPEALSAMLKYSWPGNIRELQNAMERAVVLGGDPMVLLEDLPECVLDAAGSSAAADGYHAAVREEKRRLILAAVRQSEGNYTEAARLLKLNANYLHRLIRDLNIKKEIR